MSGYSASAVNDGSTQTALGFLTVKGERVFPEARKRANTCDSRDTAAAAMKKARELVSDGCWDVKIYCPDGRVFDAIEFDQFET